MTHAAGLKKRLRGKEALPLDGMSLLSHLAKNKEIQERPLFWHFPVYLERGNAETADTVFRTRPGSAIRLGDWKLIRYFEDGREELYHLAEDTGEKYNLIGTETEKADVLSAMLSKWQSDVNAPVPVKRNQEYIPQAYRKTK